MEPDIVAFAKNFYQASPAERVSRIRARVPASLIPELAAVMQVSRVSLLGMLNISYASIRRKTRQGVMLSMEHSERVLGLLRLIGQVAVLVDDSGDSKKFNAARWVGEWLEQPVPALGGGRPAEYMDTPTAQELVSSLLIQSQVGVFA